MKASLLAISISSVLAAPAFASAPQVDVELANQQTLQLIDGQMNAIDASVQYKLNEQYANATPGTTATVDDVTYEKQSNGTWAAVGAASAALVAGLLSSSSSTSSGTDEAIPSLPVYITPDNDLPEYGEGDWGQNAVAVIGDQVIVNGETVGTISKVNNGYVITGNDGQVMSGIQMGDTEYYVISNGGELSLVHIAENGMAQIISGDRVVDAIKSADLGWGKPGTPDNDLPEYGEGDWGQNAVAVIGDQVIVNGETVGTISKVNNGYVITGNDGQVMSGIQMGDTEYYVISNGGELSLVHIAENGMAQIISGDRVVDAIKSADLGWGKPGTPDNDLPEYGEGDWGQNAVAVIGDQVIVNGETVGTISKVNNGYVITGNDGQVMSGIQMGDTEYYVISNGGELSLVHIAENGMAQIISGDRVVDAIKSADLGWGKPGTPDNDLPEYGEGDWGQNAVAVIGDQVIVNGETVGTISKVNNGYVITGNDGQVMSGIQMGDTEYYVISNGGELSLVHIAENGMAQIISGDRVVDAIKSADLGWGKPGTPDNDLPEYGEGDWGQNAVAVIGDQVIVNGETVGTISKVNNGYVITGNDGQVMSGIQMGGTEYYVISNGGELSLVHIAENGMAQIISGDRVVDAIKSADLGWGKPGTPDNDLPEYGEGDWGQNAVAVIGDQVIVNGETVGTISKVNNGYVITGNDGQVMSGIQMGDTEYYVISNGGELSLVHIAENGMAQIISGDRVVDAIKSADLGWGKPGTPDNELPSIDGGMENNHYQVSGVREEEQGHYGYFSVNGEEVAYLEYKDGQLTVTPYNSEAGKKFDVKVIDNETDGSKIVRIGGDTATEGKLVHINANGVVTPIDGNEIKSRIKSIDRSKLQSIDPTKLQKAKSAIQQRLRG
ncbi:hypothetical protein A134_04740 [Vibrio crassostreae 9CS106]|nr:hypothetical protein A134_04740 [Vibrio crassostreae 9CS106]